MQIFQSKSMRAKRVYIIVFLTILVSLLLGACVPAGNNPLVDQAEKSQEASYEVNGYLIEATLASPISDTDEDDLLMMLGEDQTVLQPIDTPADPLVNPVLIPVTGEEQCLKQGDNAVFEDRLAELINAERVNQGLQPLSVDTRLVAAARDHSTDMAFNNYFSHLGLDGSSFDDRITAQGYTYYVVGETIFAGNNQYNCPEEAFRAWLNSSAHSRIIFSDLVTELGIGYIYNPDSRYGGYFTADFASPQP